MKAAFLIKPSKIIDKPLVIKNVKAGRIGSDEVLIKIKSCGICKIDLEVIEGRNQINGSIKLPIIPGHEIIGVIDEVGEHVQDLKIGERVALGLIYESCNFCNPCKDNKFEYCESLLLTGIHADGGLAEYVKAKSKKVLKIPSWVEDVDNFFLCELAFAIKAIEYIEEPLEEKVAIVGEDILAKIMTELLKFRNIETKVFVKKNIDKDVLDYKLMEKGYFDMAITTYDSAEILENVIEKVKRGGTIVFFNQPIVKLPSFIEGKKLISIGIPGFKEIRKAIEILPYFKKMNLSKRIFELENVNEAFLEMKQRNDKKFILLNKA